MSEEDNKKLSDLPGSNDLDFWGEGERTSYTPRPIKICETHASNNWMTHTGYIANPDGTVTCKWCPWGTKVPGYLKVRDGKIVDLRSATR